jgi:hypothetical protein
VETSETFRRSEGTCGITACEVGWGTKGRVGQPNGCGGDNGENCGDEGLVQTLDSLAEATSDRLEDVGDEALVSVGEEFAGGSSS